MLEGILRESTGKKSVKALRKDGYLIANIYGKGLENINAAFRMNDFIRTVRNKENIAFDVNVGGNALKVVVQGYESHALNGNLLHVDLMVAQPGVVSTYHVPVTTVGTPIGLKNKGMLYISKKRIPVKAAIENLPNTIELDVADLDVGDSILMRELPEIEGVTFKEAGRVAVLSIIKAK